jgi:hypothetical protein
MLQGILLAAVLLIVAMTSGPSATDVAFKAVTAECGGCN